MLASSTRRSCRPRPVAAVPSRRPVRPVSLSAAIESRYAEARAAGALCPVATTARLVADGGIGFVVRVATALRGKPAAAPDPAPDAAAPRRNPFLPYEDALFVAALSPTHVALFNKFNVIDRHLLIVTRAFEDQETLLTPADWEALWCVLDAGDGLGFYNGGQAAGASQPHKHLQRVPLPLAAEGPAIPIAPLLKPLLAPQLAKMSPAGAEPVTLPAFGFRHAVARLDPGLTGAAAAAAAGACYRRLLAAVGIGAAADAAGGIGAAAAAGGGSGRQSAPYNLLVTRTWMLVVARRRDGFAGISVNALGFAGSLFVRDDEEARRVAAIGPLRLLAEVAVPAD